MRNRMREIIGIQKNRYTKTITNTLRVQTVLRRPRDPGFRARASSPRHVLHPNLQRHLLLRQRKVIPNLIRTLRFGLQPRFIRRYELWLFLQRLGNLRFPRRFLPFVFMPLPRSLHRLLHPRRAIPRPLASTRDRRFTQFRDDAFTKLRRTDPSRVWVHARARRRGHLCQRPRQCIRVTKHLSLVVYSHARPVYVYMYMCVQRSAGSPTRSRGRHSRASSHTSSVDADGSIHLSQWDATNV